MRYFYSHLIGIESIIVQLDQLQLDEGQKQHLADLLDSSIHQTVLDIVLSELNEADKRLFLSKLSDDPHSQDLMKFVTDRVDKIEDKIKDTVESLKAELHRDIKEAKKHG